MIQNVLSTPELQCMAVRTRKFECVSNHWNRSQINAKEGITAAKSNDMIYSLVRKLHMSRPMPGKRFRGSLNGPVESIKSFHRVKSHQFLDFNFTWTTASWHRLPATWPGAERYSVPDDAEIQEAFSGSTAAVARCIHLDGLVFDSVPGFPASVVPVVWVTRRFDRRWHFLTSARQIANSDQRSFFQTLVDIWCKYVLSTLMIVIDRHCSWHVMTGKVALAKACTMTVPFPLHCMKHGTAFAPSLTTWIVAMFSLHWSLPCWSSDVDSVSFWSLLTSMVWMRWLCIFFGSLDSLNDAGRCFDLFAWTASSMQTPILRTWVAALDRV